MSPPTFLVSMLTAYCSGLRSGSLQGKNPRFGNDLFDLLDKMRMAGKQQYLMSLAKLAKLVRIAKQGPLGTGCVRLFAAAVP